MKLKTVVGLAVAAALFVPLAVNAQGMSKSDPAAKSGSSDGGAEAMFKALDKNNDGSITKEEAKGTPHDKDFAMLDKNKDGKLSRAEHAAAPQHAGAKAGSSASSKGAEPTASRSSAPAATSSASGSGGASDSKGTKY
jgi:hypothetical protein